MEYYSRRFPHLSRGILKLLGRALFGFFVTSLTHAFLLLVDTPLAVTEFDRMSYTRKKVLLVKHFFFTMIMPTVLLRTFKDFLNGFIPLPKSMSQHNSSILLQGVF